MNKELLEKEKELEVSRLKHSILESEVRLLKKLEEVERIRDNITRAQELLKEKQQK